MLKQINTSTQTTHFSMQGNLEGTSSHFMYILIYCRSIPEGTKSYSEKKCKNVDEPFNKHNLSSTYFPYIDIYF